MASHTAVIVIILAKLYYCYLITIPEVPQQSNIISKYSPRHHIMIHFDNQTEKYLNMFQTIDHDYYLFNYDIIQKLRRNNGFKFVNIVILTNPLRFEQFSSRVYNLKYNDAVIFIFENYTAETKIQPWRLLGLEKVGAVLVTSLRNDDIFSVYFYGDINKPVKDKLSKSSTNLENYKELFNQFTNFKGHIFRVAYAICPPFTIEECLETHNCDLGGIEMNILKTLSKELHFGYHLINFSNREEAWKQMIMAVYNGTVDWAIGCISQTPERNVLIEFSDYLMFQHYEGVFYRMEDPSNNWKIIIEPLTTDSWIAIIIVSIFTGILLKRMHFYLSSILMKTNTNIEKIPKDSFASATFGVLFEQSIAGVRSKFLATSLTLGLWRIMAIIISNTYKSKLSSAMIMPTSYDPNTVTDLLQTNYKLEINLEDNILYTYLNEFFKRPKNVLQNFDSLSVCSGLLNLVQNKSLAIIEDKAPLHYSILTGCVRELGFENIAKLRMIRENVCPSRHAWPLQRAAPYRMSFSTVLSKLRECGIIFHWYEQYNFKLSRSNHYVPNDLKESLKLNEVMGHFYILFIGITISSLIFIFEIVQYQYARIGVKLVKAVMK